MATTAKKLAKADSRYKFETVTATKSVQKQADGVQTTKKVILIIGMFIAGILIGRHQYVLGALTAALTLSLAGNVNETR